MASPPRGPPFAGLVPPPPGVVPNFTNPASLQTVVVTVDTIFLALAALFVAMRLWTRSFVTRHVGFDDALSVVALALAVLYTVASFESLRYGERHHAWEVPSRTFQQLPYIVWSVVGYSAYMAAMGAVKLSILLLYLRLFSAGRSLRLCIYLLLAFTSSYVIAGELSLFFGCRPVRKLIHTEVAGKCLNLEYHIISQAAFNLAADVLIVAAPVPTVLALKLRTKDKVGVLAIFAVGLIVCAFSAVRLSIVANYTNPDFTWLKALATMWSLIELNLAIICSCIATLKPFLAHIVPRLRQLSSKTWSSLGYSSRGSAPASHSISSSTWTSPSNSRTAQKSHQPQPQPRSATPSPHRTEDKGTSMAVSVSMTMDELDRSRAAADGSGPRSVQKTTTVEHSTRPAADVVLPLAHRGVPRASVFDVDRNQAADRVTEARAWS
ncbi:MAG: hypothetical protein M1826_000065 [Phylliscum demangeonii]|nr:MAG: hypothetical protein M1826_000065 [Phylliscum demangeonii]